MDLKGLTRLLSLELIIFRYTKIMLSDYKMKIIRKESFERNIGTYPIVDKKNCNASRDVCRPLIIGIRTST